MHSTGSSAKPPVMPQPHQTTPQDKLGNMCSAAQAFRMTHEQLNLATAVPMLGCTIHCLNCLAYMADLEDEAAL